MRSFSQVVWIFNKLENMIYKLRWLAVFDFEDFIHEFLQIYMLNVHRAIFG